ncbi:unnamed protein product [Trichobilharzia regenti]|nr:unnamed protein product [Trichobilharzia regenti]
MDDYHPNNMGNKSSTVQSPSVMKRKTLNISGSIPATAAQNAFSPELEDTSEFTKREITPDTPDSISEQEMMVSGLGLTYCIEYELKCFFFEFIQCVS